MPNKTTLAYTFVAVGLALLVIAFIWTGYVPHQLWQEVIGPERDKPRFPELAAQARFLQTAYIAGVGLSLFTVGAVGVLTAARPVAATAE